MVNTDKIALGVRLKHCRNVITLGFKPNFTDYSAKEIELINNSNKIYYPTAFYANMFYIMGKITFPSLSTYSFVQDKIRQTSLFNLLKIPHPYTKVFYGNRHKRDILKTFRFPFVAKKPRGSSMGRGVYLINNIEELYKYLALSSQDTLSPESLSPESLSPESLSSESLSPDFLSTDSVAEIVAETGLLYKNKKNQQNHQELSYPAYIQEYCPHDRDIRVVVIGKQIAIAYWRIANSNDFRSNVSCGGDISFAPIPQKAIELALYTASKCGWDDVGLDIVEHKGDFLVIEANMKYGRKGFYKAGIDYNLLLENLIESNKI